MGHISTPLVSVILPSYNHEKYVSAAIESVLNQSFQDYELLISDDHSTDHTVDVIRQYRDDRIRLHVFSENQGATLNHKYLIDEAQGKYVALINSDDVWLPQKLEKQVPFLEANNEYGCSFSFAETIDEDGNQQNSYCEVFEESNKTQAEWYAHFFHNGNCLCHPSMLIRSEIYHALGIYNLSLRQLPDFDMWIRLIKRYNIYIFQEPLVQHRRLKNSLNTSAPTIKNSMRDAVESYYILNSYFSDVSDDLFAEAFGNEFRKEGTLTHNELCCEKYFLLLKEGYYIPRLSLLAALNYFFSIYSEKDIAATFKNSYNYTLNDFHMISWRADIQQTSLAIDDKNDYSFEQIGCVNKIKMLMGKLFGKNSRMYRLCKKMYFYLSAKYKPSLSKNGK